jgi:hypothetical protein
VELTPPVKTKYSVNRIIPPAERQDRLYAQLNKKINRQNQRITVLKMWGRC